MVGICSVGVGEHQSEFLVAVLEFHSDTHLQ